MTASRSLCAILIGSAPDEEIAEEYIQMTRICPYVACTQRADQTVIALYVLPEEKRWWIEIPAARPELLGLNKVNLLFVDDIPASSAWSRGEIQPKAAKPPCGSDCLTCSYYGDLCAGCPASVFSSHDYHSVKGEAHPT